MADEREDLEGLAREDEVSLGEYPIDTLLIRNENRTVHDILRKLETTYILNPEFQREFVWDPKKQSKLIESILMRVPLPVLYLAEDPQGKLIVVDGRQRLTTLSRFCDNKLKLVLPDQHDLNGKTFAELPPKLQNRVEDCNLIMYIIDSKVPERARLDIFERVNSGMELSRQEMRNSIYMGKATRFLADQAAEDLFITATGGSIRTEKMRDREMVNRFCAFYLLSLDKYKRDDLDDFLAQSLIEMNKMSDPDIMLLRRAFWRALTNNYEVFDRFAFRKHNPDSKERSPLNVSLWDVMTTGLAVYEPELVLSRKEELRRAFFQLLEDQEFVRSTTYSTTSGSRVKYRLETGHRAIREALEC